MNYNKQINIDEVVEFTNSLNLNTKIYIGCDSERIMLNEVWYADYITAVVVHINGNNGCKIFGAVERERDFEVRGDRPKMRLMNEVYRVSNLYLELAKVVKQDIEVHLDINPSELHKSNVALSEAIGYVRGTCNVIPMIKPRAWAATCAADRYKEIVNYKHAA